MGRGNHIPAFATAFLLLAIVPSLYSGESTGHPYFDVFSSTTYYNSTTLYVTDNISIESGETLIFDDTTVYFNCSYDGELGIIIDQGGKCEIKNGTKLTLNRTGSFSNNYGYNYFIQCNGTLIISDSNISFAGWGNGFTSGVIGNRYTTATGSVFYSCYNGLFAGDGDLGTIDSSDFINCVEHGIAGGFDRRINIMKCNFISLGGWGIHDNGTGFDCRFDLERNTFRDCMGGVYLNTIDYVNFLKNEVVNCSSGGIRSTTALIWASMFGTYMVSDNYFENLSNGIDINVMTRSTVFNNNFFNISGTGLKYQGYVLVQGGKDTNHIDQNQFRSCGTGCISEISKEDRFFSNLFKNNSVGLRLKGSEDADIVNNTFRSCSSFGLEFDTTAMKNNVHKNLFSENNRHVKDSGSQKFSNDGKGNYWTGLEGYTDWNGDGVYDQPYRIDMDSIDHFPLVPPGVILNRGIDLQPIPDQTIDVEERLEMVFLAEDPDGDDPYYEVETDTPITFEFNNYTGEFKYTAKWVDIGSIELMVSVYDQNGSFDTDPFRIEVLPIPIANKPPIVEPIPDLITVPGIRAAHQINVNDPDNDPISISVIKNTAPFGININKDMILSILPDKGDEGTYFAELKISDNNGSIVISSFNITVEHINEPPEIKPVSDQEVVLGYLFTIEMEAYDPDGDPISFNMTYSGDGDHRITDEGSIMIEPVPSDVGIQRVRAIVSDSKGANSTVGFDLEVIYVNAPPQGTMDYSFKVVSGDIARFPLDLQDPEGGNIVFLEYGGEPPEWISFDDVEMELVARPSLEDKGEHNFMAAASDDESDPVILNFQIRVYEGKLSPLNVPLNILITEGESRVVALDFEYDLNGTKFIDLEEISPCLSVEDNTIRIKTGPGDNGTHTVLVNYGIVNGLTRTAELKVHVKLNTTLIDIEVTRIPNLNIYEFGDRISMNIDLKGVEGTMTITWRLSVSDMMITMGSGPDIIVTLDMVGTWELDIFLNDNPGVVHAEEIIVVDKPETTPDDGPSTTAVVLITIFTSLFILIISSVVFILIRRRGSGSAKENGDQFWLDGFKAAPPVDPSHLKGKLPEPVSEKDYTPGEPSKHHEVTDRSGKSGDTGFP